MNPIDDVLAERGERTVRALLRAHASLVRELGIDLLRSTGLSLGAFDVLAQLALAGGELRMTELAARVSSSRSGMTRRVDRLVVSGLVGRSSDDTDARGVVVTLTEAGLARLRETVPVHLRGISRLFADRLEDEELAVLERALDTIAPMTEVPPGRPGRLAGGGMPGSTRPGREPGRPR